MDPQQAIEQADNMVMAFCAPGKMTQRQALEFLEGLAINISAAADALRDEIEEE